MQLDGRRLAHTLQVPRACTTGITLSAADSSQVSAPCHGLIFRDCLPFSDVCFCGRGWKRKRGWKRPWTEMQAEAQAGRHTCALECPELRSEDVSAVSAPAQGSTASEQASSLTPSLTRRQVRRKKRCQRKQRFEAQLTARGTSFAKPCSI